MLVDEFVSLTALDRCDKCGAQAVSQSNLGAPSLLFCGHCTNKFKDALLDQGFTIRWDEEQEYYNC